jgi:hypothetical protein
MPKHSSASSDSPKSGADLFIVDNSDADWKVRQYLEEWADISHQFDIATGYFELGALLALDGRWQKLDKLRILMGDEVSKRTRTALLAGVQAIVRRLDASLEREKQSDDFLVGAEAVVAALHSGQIQCKVYNREKFHAKAYITHARQAVVGSSALVGSSNFTFPGLTDNVELNVQIRREVGLLQEWYERHWNDAEDVTADVLRTIERHVREYSPFEVYAKALREYFQGGGALGPDEWEATRSIMFKVLDQYQKDGYKNLIRIAHTYNGALLCDGVGLGKTFIGLMLIERFAVHENKNVLLLVPKSGREAVWKPELAKFLPRLSQGLFGGRLEILTHTDLSAPSKEAQARFAEAKEHAHVVIIDEAHNFRNVGTRGEFTADIDEMGPARGGKLIEGEGKVKPSRYRRLFDLIGEKPVFLLTATPVNNELSDLRHLIELFSRRRDDYFANLPVAVSNLRSYFNQLKKRLESATHGSADITNLEEAKAVLDSDGLVSALVVQRGRGYVKEHQKIHGGRTVVFPERQPPQVASYSLKGVYGKLLDQIAEAFDRKKPLFSLPMYQAINYLIEGIDESDEAAIFAKGRQTQIVALIRTQFVKRLESSVVAFEKSCQRLLIKLLAFVVKHMETASERKQFDTWMRSHKHLVAELQAKHPKLFTVGREPTLLDDFEDDQDSLLDDDLLDIVEQLDRKLYRVGDMLGETMQDLGLVAQMLDELRGFKPKQDVKLQALIKLLKSDKVLKAHKVMIFTEFADTAEYLRTSLIESGIEGVEAIDGSAASRDRVGVIKRFAPYYNRSNSSEANAAGGEIRVLVSTDVLSEGLNLQDATRLINYELHWNPVRLMQRIGRVDRRMNQEIEEKLLADHPEQKDIRGTAAYWNFLPPEELSTLLTLYARVTKKTLNISKTFGIEGKKLIRPEDDYDALKDFNAAYEARTAAEDLSLEYESLLRDHSGLAEKLDALPGRVFSGKAHPKPGTRAVFFCFQLPTRVVREGWASDSTPLFKDATEPGWTVTEGPVRWYIVDLASGEVTQPDLTVAAGLIRCGPDEPRAVSGQLKKLSEARAAVEKHIKNTYLKQLQAPVNAPKPLLKCWMELS